MAQVSHLSSTVEINWTKYVLLSVKHRSIPSAERRHRKFENLTMDGRRATDNE